MTKRNDRPFFPSPPEITFTYREGPSVMAGKLEPKKDSAARGKDTPSNSAA